MVNDILGIIPARKGSKGFVGKNIHTFLGKPLIWWTIHSAIESEFINDIVVTSDDLKVLEIADEMGVQGIDRPEYLASDTATTADAIVHALGEWQQKKRKKPSHIVLLQCTSPLRQACHIDEAIDNFVKNSKEADTLIAVTEKEHPVEWLRTISEEGYLKKYIEEKKDNSRRQDFGKIYEPNGAIYIAKTDFFLEYKTFQSERTMPYIMDREVSIDIDTEYDFKLAEYLGRGRS